VAPRSTDHTAATAGDDTRGIVHPAAGFEHFTLTRHEPADDLRWAVDRFWIVRWNLPEGESFDQRIVPHPAVHVVCNAGEADVEAISAEEFVRRLEGRGQVLGVKFQPAGFRPFLGRPVSTIAGKRLPAVEILGRGIDDLARRLADADDLDATTGLVEDFLRSLGIGALPVTVAVNTIVGQIVADRSITRVDALARRLCMSTRSLQRLFADHVGLGPKWVINRCRIHEAAEVAAGSTDVDWADLAAALGYSDQSHLVREFTAAVGTPPDRYARESGSTDPA
jgi:AraC-like DNA-binding protein